MTTVMTRNTIEDGIVELLNDMVLDWELELEAPIGRESRLIEDLGFESIDLVQLVVAIESKFAGRGIPYEELIMDDGRYVTEITVGQLANFLHSKIGTA